jgi:hypothetical protein
MLARVAMFEGGDIEQIRKLNEERRASGSSGMPEGVSRILVLNEGERNRRLFVTFFETREALDAAEAQFESMGNEIPEDVRGRRLSVDVYDVAYDGEP